MDWRIATLIAVVTLGIYNVLLKKLVTDYDWRVAIPVILVVSVVLVAYFALTYKEFSNKMNFDSISLATALILLIAVSNIFVLVAYSNGGSVNAVIPLLSLATIVSVVIAAVYLHEEVSLQIVAGIILGLMSIFLLTYK